MKKARETPIPRQELAGLILVLTLAALPHVLHLTPAVGLCFGALVALRLLSLWRPALLPGRLLLLLLTLIGVGLVLNDYPALFGKAAGSALLTVMTGLKLLEMRSRRDLYVLVFMGFFILVTQFLFFRGIPILLHALAVTLGLTALLLEASRATPSSSPWPPLHRAVVLLAQSLPLMLVLFLLFPRFSSPLWNLGPEQTRGVTGVSDRLSPGSVSQLALSRAIAFRVEFEGAVPPPRERYWRGRVIWQTDGVEWRGFRQVPALEEDPRAAQRDFTYRVTLEPFPGNWLYALDRPLEAPPGAWLTRDLQLLRRGPVKQRMRYRAVSARTLEPPPLTAAEREQGLQLPDNISPRMRRLAGAWRRQSRDPQRVVDLALAFFREQPFYYTLYPPRLEGNPADQFLFETRRGFCEHYATSFTLLMRLAGIPARVVVGYQGGELNPLGGYLIVRQSDAHAWAEVWLEGKGWSRVDPTAAVAPARIERRLDPDLIDNTPGAPIDFVHLDPGPVGRLLHRIGLGVDALNSGWQRWVLGYSKERQQQLMQMLGLDFLQGIRLAVGMLAAAALIVAVMSLWILLRDRREKDRVRHGYDRFCRKLARAGLPRKPHEGPRDYSRRVSMARPDLAGQVAGISRLYIVLRYGQAGRGRAGQRRFRRMVRQFRPRR